MLPCLPLVLAGGGDFSSIPFTGYNTPANVHYGLDDIIRQKRQGVLDAAYASRPDRFWKPPQAPQVPQATWINRPEEEPDTI